MESITEVTATALRGDLLERLSVQLRESPSATRRGVEHAVPISIAGLAAHASSETGAAALLGTLRGGSYPHVDAAELAQTARNPEATARLAESGTGFLGQIFGNRLSGIIDSFAGQSGVSRSSATTLLGLATPMVLNAVGKEADARQLDARGLSRFMADQGRQASNVLPAQLSSALGGGPRTGPELRQRGRAAVDEWRHREPRPRAARAPEYARPQEPKRRGLMMAIIFGLLALFGLWLARNARAPKAPEIEMPAPSAELPSATPKAAPRQAEPGRPAAEQQQQPQQQQGTAAPGGVATLTALTAATGAKPLEDFLAGDKPVPQRFALDGVEFSPDDATIAGSPLLDQVASTLDKHENARVRIDGHADATGDPGTNTKLSIRRADAVKSYLITKKVDGSRIETSGLGAEAPVATNDTASGRAENRRVDLVVVER